jgi:hypothetical protein
MKCQIHLYVSIGSLREWRLWWGTKCDPAVKNPENIYSTLVANQENKIFQDTLMRYTTSHKKFGTLYLLLRKQIHKQAQEEQYKLYLKG